MASFIGSGNVSNPMTSDLLANGFNITGGATYSALRAEAQTLAVPAGSGLTEIVSEDNILIQGDNGLLFGAPSLGTASIKIEGDPGKDIIFGPVPAGAQTNILGYNTATNKLTYFATPGSGGGVSGIGAGANITVDSTNPAVPVVSLRAPLTSVLDVGTQDITTSVANADIDITTNGTGGVHIVQAGVSGNGAVRIIQTGSGTLANPALRLVNQNATGSVGLEIYKNNPNPGSAGDVLHTMSVYGKDSANAKQEYTRISHTIREATVGTEDGSIEFGCFTNGTFQNYIQINGNDPANGEVNILRPLDLASGSTGLIKTSVVNGNINITSDGLGYTALNSASGQVQLNGGNSVVAKGVNGVLLQTGLGVDKLKVLPTAVELAGVPLDAMGQRVKSSSGSFLLGDGSISVDTRISGLGVYLTAGTNDTAYRFLDCFGLTGDVYIYRRTNFTDTTGPGQPAVFEVVTSPFRSLQMSGLPIAPASGISDGITTGSVGQVITANGSSGWSWQTPSAPPADSLSAVLSAGNNAGGNGIDMNSNNLINARNFSWGFAGGTTEFAGTTAPAPSGSAIGSIPIDIGGTTYYIPYYS